MKTLKTIGAAFALTLLVSAVSAPAMETVRSVKDSVVTGLGNAGKSVAAKAVNAKDWVADTKVANVITGAVKAADNKLFGNVISFHDDGNNVQGGLPVLRSYLRSTNGFVRAGTVVAIAAIPVAAYKAYSYLTSEEAEEAEEVSEEVVQNVAPVTEEVSAPVETPVVEAPKAEAKSVRKSKTGVRRMAKAPKSAKSRAAVNGKAKRNAPAKAKVARNAGCQNGKCGVRRSK